MMSTVTQNSRLAYPQDLPVDSLERHDYTPDKLYTLQGVQATKVELNIEELRTRMDQKVQTIGKFVTTDYQISLFDALCAESRKTDRVPKVMPGLGGADLNRWRDPITWMMTNHCTGVASTTYRGDALEKTMTNQMGGTIYPMIGSEIMAQEEVIVVPDPYYENSTQALPGWKQCLIQNRWKIRETLEDGTLGPELTPEGKIGFRYVAKKEVEQILSNNTISAAFLKILGVKVTTKCVGIFTAFETALASTDPDKKLKDDKETRGQVGMLMALALKREYLDYCGAKEIGFESGLVDEFIEFKKTPAVFLDYTTIDFFFNSFKDPKILSLLHDGMRWETRKKRILAAFTVGKALQHGKITNRVEIKLKE